MDPGSIHTHTHQDLTPLPHTLDLDRFTWSVDSVTRHTAAAWMIESKSSKTGPEGSEKLAAVGGGRRGLGRDSVTLFPSLSQHVKCIGEQDKVNQRRQTQRCYTREAENVTEVSSFG